MIEAQRPDYVHIATDGPLGLMARHWCIRNKRPFSTTYHTRFPEYVAARLPVPLAWLYAFVRWFHNRGGACMVATESLRRELAARGNQHLCLWSRGIDTAHFRPREKSERTFGLPRPIFMTVGRVAVEKRTFPPSSISICRARKWWSEMARPARTAGALSGRALYRRQAWRGSRPRLCGSRCLRLPVKDRHLWQYILEALASGVPVAAYPVTGPVDIIPAGSHAGALDHDLQIACIAALQASPASARRLAETYSWEAATQQFFDNVVEAKEQRRKRGLRQRFGAARPRSTPTDALPPNSRRRLSAPFCGPRTGSRRP